MKTIYRLENKKGMGCYYGKTYEKEGELLKSHFFREYSKKDEVELHPQPFEDKGIDREIVDNEICGFKTLKQAEEWFTSSELRGLRKFGYILKKVIVKKITAIGEKQVLAIR